MTKKKWLSYSLACAGLTFVLLLLYFAAAFAPFLYDRITQKDEDALHTSLPLPVMETDSSALGEVNITPYPDSYRIDGVPIIAQRPNFPTGCESASAVMALQYLGIEITVGEFVDDHLAKSRNFYTENGIYYGPDPYKEFVGNPRDDSSFGCMAPVIEEALKKCLGDQGTVERLDGYDLDTLCKLYITHDRPVLIWATINMLETYGTVSWHLEDESLFTWPANEHCLLLVGFTETHYIFNDPWTGRELSFPKSLVENRFDALGKQAVVLY